MLETAHSEESQEVEIKIEPQNHEAAILTFENVVTKQNPAELTSGHICQVCHLVFQSNRTLLMHQKRKHKAFRRYFKHICDHCGMSYEMKNSLVAHMKRKHGPNATPDDSEERTCEICFLVFKGMPRLRMHMRRKHGSFQESFKHACKECGLTYEKYGSLVVHMQRKHTMERKPLPNQWYNCAFCSKIFSRRETYARHVQRNHHINDDVEPTQNNDSILNECKNEAGEISCKQCPQVFSSVNFLKLHMRRKHNALKEDFRLKCRICNLSYDKVESLKRHVRRKHDNRSHCNVCNKQFNTKTSYLNHSHGKHIHECKICGLIFASQGGLSKHIRCTHKIDSPKVVFCNICNEGFHDKRQLKPHLLRVHLKVSYTCNYCNKVFKAKESYRRHIIFKHPDRNEVKQEMQKCDQCPATFPDEFELCRHINFEHRNTSELLKGMAEIKKEEGEPEAFQCTKCSDSYATWEELKLHYEQNHHKNDAQCQICGEIVKFLDLPKHIKTMHNEVTEMKCKYCDYKSTSKASLTQHMLRHKNATTFHCDFSNCRYKSYYEGAMEKHKRKHADQGVKLQCTKCTFQSMNKYIMKYHEEAHLTGKKRYACDQCDYATILPANLVQHKYKHATVKRFKCEYCPFASKYNTSLRFHVKKKHCFPTVVE